MKKCSTLTALSLMMSVSGDGLTKVARHLIPTADDFLQKISRNVTANCDRILKKSIIIKENVRESANIPVTLVCLDTITCSNWFLKNIMPNSILDNQSLTHFISDKSSIHSRRP